MFSGSGFELEPFDFEASSLPPIATRVTHKINFTSKEGILVPKFNCTF